MPELSDYSRQRDEYYNDKLVEVRKKLPKFLTKYFISKQDLLPITLYNYAVDLTMFFEWARDQFAEYADTDIRDLPLEILEKLTTDDLNEYIKEYLKKYEHDEKLRVNDDHGKQRKLASLRSVYQYFTGLEKLPEDPAADVTLKKAPDHIITYLQPNEVAILLDCIESDYLSLIKCENINNAVAQQYRFNRLRDLAIVTLLLGTGIRVSECVGLDVTDLDFKDNAIHITRKGHRRDTVYMENEEVKNALLDYLNNARSKYLPPKDEKALFLSQRHKRMAVRSIEEMLDKYVKAALPSRAQDKISPHKMRSTFGTMVYKGERDIKQVADVLGHSNITTSQTYYSGTDDEIKRQAFRSVRLRDKEKN